MDTDNALGTDHSSIQSLSGMVGFDPFFVIVVHPQITCERSEKLSLFDIHSPTRSPELPLATQSVIVTLLIYLLSENPRRGDPVVHQISVYVG